MLLLAVLLQATSAQSPPALPPLHGGPQTMICPVGGERFEALVASHYSTFGERPDGKPFASWLMPLPIPECPSNGLVLLEPYDERAVATLTPLIASQEYRAMVEADSTYYRAQWIARKLGWAEPKALGLLLAATWQVKPQSGPTGQGRPSREKAIAYQAEFARRVAALPDAIAAPDLMWLQSRAANALREIGRFRDAEAMRLRALATATRAERNARWRDYLGKLGAVIARGDASAEPVDMVDEVVAIGQCADLPNDRDAFSRAWCAEPSRAAKIDGVRAQRAKFRRNREM